MPDLIANDGFGANQFAYSPERGAKDALAFVVLTWITGWGAGLKFGVYCSDVSGAFDKVNSNILKAKLEEKQVNEDIQKVLTSWLEPRRAEVAVGGQSSKVMLLDQMVYQGTVLGPHSGTCTLPMRRRRCGMQASTKSYLLMI